MISQFLLSECCNAPIITGRSTSDDFMSDKTSVFCHWCFALLDYADNECIEDMDRYFQYYVSTPEWISFTIEDPERSCSLCGDGPCKSDLIIGHGTGEPLGFLNQRLPLLSDSAFEIDMTLGPAPDVTYIDEDFNGTAKHPQAGGTNEGA